MSLYPIRMSGTSDAPAPPAPTPTPVPQIADHKKLVHASLKPMLEQNGWEARTTDAGVLQAVCTQTVSFSSLERYNSSAKAVSKEHSVPIETIIGTLQKELVLSTRVGGKRKRNDSNNDDGRAASNPERSTEELRDKIRATLATLSKNDSGPPKSELDKATTILDAVVCMLRAVGGHEERVVQSYGIFYKKLAPSDQRNRIVLAFRLHAGSPVRITDLKQCLGECWRDGAITSSDRVSGIDSVSLPLSDEGAISLEYGNVPILMVTSVALQ